MVNTDKKILRRYVIATLDNPTLYLFAKLRTKSYAFSDNLVEATKTTNKTTAQDIINYFRHDTEMNIDLVIIPIDITYELKNEFEALDSLEV